MKLTDGEKLIALMLADLMKHLQCESEIDPQVVEDAITGGRLWTLKRKVYYGLFAGQEPEESEIDEVRAVLSMCHRLESAIENLEPDDLAEIPHNKRKLYRGFAVDAEEQYADIAAYMIENDKKGYRFDDRLRTDDEEQMPTYRRMLAIYEKVKPRGEWPTLVPDLVRIVEA